VTIAKRPSVGCQGLCEHTEIVAFIQMLTFWDGARMSRQCPVGIGRRRANSTLSGRLGYWRGGRWNGMMFESLVPGKSPATDVPPAPRQLMGDRLAGVISGP
jgi:hypothetical protein